MKQIIFFLGILMTANIAFAQKSPELDKSPLDIAYYPANYPILKMRGQSTGEPNARILYSRPQKKGREIFGGEVKYDEIWRMGANESTEIELFKNATIGGKKIPKGKYNMFCIPSETKWTIIINKDLFSWGSFNYNKEKDVARIEIPVQKSAETVEAFTMFFETGSSNNLVIMWEGVKVQVPVSF